MEDTLRRLKSALMASDQPQFTFDRDTVKKFADAIEELEDFKRGIPTKIFLQELARGMEEPLVGVGSVPKEYTNTILWIRRIAEKVRDL